MKKLIQFLFFPAVPYPAALLWHLILGGFVAFVLVLLTQGETAAATYTTGITGGAIGVVAGFMVWLVSRSDTSGTSGVTRMKYAAEGRYFNEAQAKSGLATYHYPGKWNAAKNYVALHHPGLEVSAYWDAVRLHYLELGGLWQDQIARS